MRGGGQVDSARGLGPHDHLCWAFTDRAEFGLRVRECVTDALSAGWWVEYVGAGTPAGLRRDLTRILGRELDDLSGVTVRTAEDFWVLSGDGRVEPEPSVARMVTGTQAALAAGYPGFCAVGDCTPVVRTPEQRTAFARFEYLVDREVSRHPVSALCGYDVAALGAAAVAELACLHPRTSTGTATFRLYAAPGVECALAGEVDLSCAGLFATALDRTVARPVDAATCELVVDATGVRFIDHRGVLALAAAARRAGRPLVLCSDEQGSLARLVEILAAPELRVRETA